MTAVRRSVGSWLYATVDVALAVLALAIVLFPGLSVANALAGEPLSPSTVVLVVGAFALGGAYPFVAGDWTPDALGEFVFAIVVAAFGWGIVGAVAILASGAEFTGGDPRPGAAVVALAYLTAFGVVRVAAPILD